MKVVALALTLLLALGCHARTLQADAPTQLEHYKAVASVYLTQVKDQAYKALENLDRGDYEQYKLKLTQSLDNLQKYADSTSSSLKPFATQLVEGTQAVHNYFLKELDDLHAKVEPHRAELRQAIEKHLDEYGERLIPIFRDYMVDNQKEINALRQKLQPALDDLKAKVDTNIEETKTKLAPIVEAVRGKLTERLQNLKDLASPVAEEYKEHMLKAIEDVKGKLAPHTTQLQSQIEPYMETLRAKFQSIYESVAQALHA
ncbi:apolipoprotein A-I-like [Tachysurus vachellii]|uniref:apolipoprotein A-I-like n=1 Tax=Tachysurus vachellii TaxID=175792 RepID=UPI00296ADD81|nr:apolipoprotein A-I-like [Tachysurus vachellii]